MQIITTEQLSEQLDKSEVKIIDIRSVGAYNGWCERQESRGGHIKGARSLPYKWINYIDWIEIVRAKQIGVEDKLIVYGYDAEEVNQTAEQFVRAGYNKTAVYHQFVREWSGDNRKPMEKLDRYQNLVSAEWVRELTTTDTAPEYSNQRYVICHTHYQNPEAYTRGHIPGAIAVDTNTLESEETWNRRTPEELKKTLEALGISHDTTVILYGRFDFPDFDDPFPGSSAGHLGSIRAAFIMLYAGVKDVRILNGGLQSWEDSGFSTTQEITKPLAVEDFGCTIPAQPQLAVDVPQAKEIIKAEDQNLVSVRSWSEYIGEVSGYHYIEKKGRIPGSVFGNCGSDAYHMENYRNLDHTMREYHEIEALWKEAGITKDRFNAFYCGTGWRGSEAFFNAWLMGWPQVAVYDGGWFEWSNDDSNPFETGVPGSAAMIQKGMLVK